MSKGPYVRKDRLIKEKRHDVYRNKRKWPEPTLCPDCGALLVNGRWTWKNPPEKVNRAICPACRRIADNYPAGIVEIKGPFFAEHREEILNLVRNVEKDEKAAHPLERIASIIDETDHTLVTTTGVHVARRIGEALLRSYRGDLPFRYAEAAMRIRIYWER
jgi:NMD protein affecting ribosome stability and mRNA decay